MSANLCMLPNLLLQLVIVHKGFSVSSVVLLVRFLRCSVACELPLRLRLKLGLVLEDISDVKIFVDLFDTSFDKLL